MRRKVKVSDVRLGMYIDELCGSWMDHPFWRTSFLLEDAGDLDTLRKSAVRDVWIDTTRGLDLLIPPEYDDEAATEQYTEAVLLQAVEPEPARPQQTSLEGELARARVVQARAKQAVMDMFAEARMGNALPTGAIAGLVDEIDQSVARNSGALLSLVRLKDKDDYTYLHSVAVCALMLALGRQLGLSQQLSRTLGMAGLLHDVGKMAIPSQVLDKPGRLTDEEFAIIKSHPELGWDLLRKTQIEDEIVLDVCRHHHERVDGTGYPDGLSGEALSLYARMGAVCDVYDAVTSNRCYKAGWAPADALRKMAGWQDGHFDDRIFKAFVKTVGIYPVGTLVRLKSGRLGVVVGQSAKSLLLPVVKVFFSTLSNARIRMEQIDLSLAGDAVNGVEDPDVWRFDVAQIMAA
ncbi:MAG: HD-GYP domain-containing protein [Betaproteobacteria bacterium]|nr:HD-GYP domain-containing protein [Betaproteobacteria bacterium]